MKDSGFGKNNFDRLAAAGLVAGADDSENLKAKTEARVQEITLLIGKVAKVQAFLSELYVLPKNRQLKRLEEASTALKKLYSQKLPVGAKRHIETCLNEVTSLREGVYVANASLDKKTLALTASAKAKTELKAMVEAAKHRLTQVQADSTHEEDMDDFFENAKEIIERNNVESTKLAPIKDKVYMVARVPVVPADGSSKGGKLNAAKLAQLGFKVENLSDFPVIHNQLVLGINPKLLSGHDPAAAGRFAAMTKQLKDSGVDPKKIEELQKEARDVNAQLEKLSKSEDSDPEEIARLQDNEDLLQGRIMRMIKEAGVDPAEIKKLESQLRRMHSAMPKAVEAERDRLIKALEKKMKVKLRRVSETPRSYRSGIWFWLMPDRDLDQLAKATPDRRVKITRWGFAFD